MSRSQRSWTLFKRSIEIVGSNKSLLRLRTSIERGSFMRRTICVVIALAGAGFGLLAFAADEGSTVPTKDPVVIEFMTALKLQEKYEAERVAKQDENAASLADQKLPEAKRKKMAAANKKVDALVRAEAGWDSVKDDIAKGYHTLCGDDEMRQIIVFFKTPIGKKMIETEVAVVPKAWAIREKTIMKTRDPKADKRSTVPAKDLLVTEFMTAFKLQEKYQAKLKAHLNAALALVAESFKSLPAESRKQILAASKKEIVRALAEAGWDKVEDDFAKVYRGVYTDDEMRQIIAFLKTPIGKRMTEIEVAMVPKTMAIMMKFILPLQPKMMALLKEAYRP